MLSLPELACLVKDKPAALPKWRTLVELADQHLPPQQKPSRDQPTERQDDEDAEVDGCTSEVIHELERRLSASQ